MDKKNMKRSVIAMGICCLLGMLPLIQESWQEKTNLSGALKTSAASIESETSEKKADSISEKEEAVINATTQMTAAVENEYPPAGKDAASDWRLILVNKWNKIPEGYEVTTQTVEYGHEVDERIADALEEMLSDCRDEGYSPLICSSYRSTEKQQRLFNADVNKFLRQGYTQEEAEDLTAESVAIPATSEHEIGLALDIVYSGYQQLDDAQADNETQQWLMKNCARYGFILRYPQDKTEITGITYEPWHYRYVGKEAAEYIMSHGICLEEYLGRTDHIESESVDG